MAYTQHAYSPLDAQNGLQNGPDQRSTYAPSYVSQDAMEMRSHRRDSSQARLLSLSQDKHVHDNSPIFIPQPSRHFASLGPGLWKNQMLVDRSLRGMALLTSIFAISMLVIVFVWLPKFVKNENPESTSVFASEESCKSASYKNTAIHLIINIAATMVLGMSNTYQQLITALDVNDIPSMLENHGDCKVGTNSPFSINRKKKGKLGAWLSWILLIATSLPIHLLANAFVGLSLSNPPTKIDYTPVKLQPANTTLDGPSFRCWSVFRTGSLWWRSDYPPSEYLDPGQTIEEYLVEFMSAEWDWPLSVEVKYDREKCSSLLPESSVLPDRNELEKEWSNPNATCLNGIHVECESIYAYELEDREEICQISIRMQAAITLAGALLLKAIYMIAWNIVMRGRLKTRCLTFGDVIAASALNPHMQVPNECMVNAGDAYRKQVTHRCHKHCKSKIISTTGDELGHCQKCKKFNQISMSAGLEHPIVATKYKKSLISNLGSNAVVQMILLSFGSMAMLGISIFVAVLSGSRQRSFQLECKDHATTSTYYNETDYNLCMKDAPKHWTEVSGGWGGGYDGGVSLGGLPSNKIGSETASFIIANGAQLIYSLLYLLVIYNITLISMERDWGSMEMKRSRLRSTIYQGQGFYQSYLLQLPKRIIFPTMVFSALMHWLLGQAISTKEWAWFIKSAPAIGLEAFHVSQYMVVYAAYPVWLSTVLMIAMTSVCWWAFTYSREGYMPQMYGSIRVCCASTTALKELPADGIQWGDLGMGIRFRRAGFSDRAVAPVVPGELYCSSSAVAEEQGRSATSSLKQRYSSDTMRSAHLKTASQQLDIYSSGSYSVLEYQYHRTSYQIP